MKRFSPRTPACRNDHSLFSMGLSIHPSNTGLSERSFIIFDGPLETYSTRTLCRVEVVGESKCFSQLLLFSSKSTIKTWERNIRTQCGPLSVHKLFPIHYVGTAGMPAGIACWAARWSPKGCVRPCFATQINKMKISSLYNIER